jgi:hypothetical protein
MLVLVMQSHNLSTCPRRGHPSSQPAHSHEVLLLLVALLTPIFAHITHIQHMIVEHSAVDLHEDSSRDLHTGFAAE